MVKYDLMLAKWASGSITNRFSIEFWVYKVISPKTVIRRLRRLLRFHRLQKIGYDRFHRLHTVGATSLQSFIDAKFDQESLGDTAHSQKPILMPFSGFKQKSGFRKSCKKEGTQLQRRLS